MLNCFDTLILILGKEVPIDTFQTIPVTIVIVTIGFRRYTAIIILHIHHPLAALLVLAALALAALISGGRCRSE